MENYFSGVFAALGCIQFLSLESATSYNCLSTPEATCQQAIQDDSLQEPCDPLNPLSMWNNPRMK